MVNLNCRKKSESQFWASGQSPALSIFSWNWPHPALQNGRCLHSAELHQPLKDGGTTHLLSPFPIFMHTAFVTPLYSFLHIKLSHTTGSLLVMLMMSLYLLEQTMMVWLHCNQCWMEMLLYKISAFSLRTLHSFLSRTYPHLCWLPTLEVVLSSHSRANPVLESQIFFLSFFFFPPIYFKAVWDAVC